MKENTTKNGKKIAGLVLSAVLVIGSLGTAAAFAANSSDAVPKNTVISAPAAPSPSETIPVTLGTIQYSKEVYATADGSQNFTMETWFNPETKDRCTDLKEYSPDHQLTRHQSTYYVNGGSEYIIIQRDLNTGNPVSGTLIKPSDEPTIFQKLGTGSSDFDSVKAWYTSSRWTNIGTEQAADGKTLIKLTDSWQKWTGNGDITTDKEYNVQDITYIDQNTGLPVKEELYEDSTGQNKLLSTETQEYKYTSDDGTLFKVPDITLTPYQAPSQTQGK